MKTNTYSAKDNKSIFYYHWQAKSNTSLRGVVQIAHGLGEHAKRYESIALVLNEQGFDVYANDHRGHGRTETNSKDLGYFEDGNFWEKAVNDMYQLTSLIKEEHPNKPILLIGHSMGSILSRDYITQYGNKLSGVLISGTASYRPFLSQLGLFIVRILTFFYGRKSESKLLKSLFFDDFNRNFKPNRTKFDWISRDEREVDVFVADKLRIEDFSIGLLGDVIKGMKKVNQKTIYEQTPKDLPIFIFSGDRDPVGDMGKGIEAIFKAFQNAGHKKVTYKLYKDGRHEMLNEINRKEVFTDIRNWINQLQL